MLWDERSAVQRASQTPATGLPVEMGMEALTAGFNFTQDEEKSTSLERALWEEYDTYLDGVEQATGARIPNPIGFAPRDYEDRPAGMTGQLGAQVRLRRQQEEIGGPVTGMPGFEEQLKKARDLNPQNFPEPPTASQLLDRITNKLGMSRERYEDMQSRMTTGGTVASVIGSMGAIATDPMVAPTLPFGAGAGRALVTKMLIEAGIAGASELAVQPYIMRGKEAIESPYTAGDAAVNVLAAAGLGAAFPAAGALLRAGGRGATRVLDRAFHPERPLVRPATPTERAAVADVEREMMVEETAPTVPADIPAHVERFDAEVEAVRETGAPSQLADLDAPVAPERAAELDAADRLDDVTAREIDSLAREDADLALALDTVESIRAYHGSPHTFERFDMSRIGTGEGAQAYGRGLYFAEDPAIAGHYRDALSGPQTNISINGKRTYPGDVVGELMKDLNEKPLPSDPVYKIKESTAFYRGLMDAVYDFADGKDGRQVQNLAEDTGQDFSDGYDAGMAGLSALDAKPAKEGSLYTVDLAVSRDDLLDWDAPLSQQSEKVRDALDAILPPEYRTDDQGQFANVYGPRSDDRPVGRVRKDDDGFSAFSENGELGRFDSFTDAEAAVIKADGGREGISGASLYKLLAREYGGGEEVAAKMLRDAGVPGLRYLDAGSRAGGEGTSNIVMFDESLVTIRAINDQPIPDPAEAAKELEAFTGSPAEEAMLTADVERALGPPPLTPEQIAAQKKLNRSVAARKGALTVTRDVFDNKGKPKSLLAWLKAAGGIKDEAGELKALDLQSSRPGTVRRTGNSIEKAARMAVEDGFLPEARQDFRYSDGTPGMEPTDDFVERFMVAIEDELRGKKRYSEEARAQTEEAEFAEAASKAADELTYRMEQLEGRMAEAGFDAPPAMMEEALSRAAGRGTDALDELDALIEEDAVRLAEDWETAVADDLDDIPFEPRQAAGADRTAAGASQAARGDAGGQAGVAALDQEPAGVGQAPGGIRSEPGAEGFEQLIIPGAERSAQQALEARADRGLAAKAPQRAADQGLFAPPEDLRQMAIPVDGDVDPFTGEAVPGLRTAQDLLDELDADQRTLDEMASCATPGVRP